MSTTPHNMLQQARQGNPEAIAALMNQHLQDRGITAQVTQQGDSLHVVLESAQTLAQPDLVNYVKKGVSGLSLSSVQALEISGRQTGHSSPDWTETVTFEVASNNGTPQPVQKASMEPPASSVDTLDLPAFSSNGDASSDDLDLDLSDFDQAASIDDMGLGSSQNIDAELDFDFDAVLEQTETSLADDLSDLGLSQDEPQADDLDLDLNTGDLETDSLDLGLDDRELEKADLENLDLDLTDASAPAEEDFDLNFDVDELQETTDALDAALSELDMGSADVQDGSEAELESFEGDLDLNWDNSEDGDLDLDVDFPDITDSELDLATELDLDTTDADKLAETTDLDAEPPEFDLSFDASEPAFETPDLDLNFQADPVSKNPPELDLDLNDSLPSSDSAPDSDASTDLPFSASFEDELEMNGFDQTGSEEDSVASVDDLDDLRDLDLEAPPVDPVSLSLGDGLEGDLWSTDTNQVDDSDQPVSHDLIDDIEWELDSDGETSHPDSVVVDETPEVLDPESALDSADIDWDSVNLDDAVADVGGTAEEELVDELPELKSDDGFPNFDLTETGEFQSEVQSQREVEPVDLMLSEDLDISSEEFDLSSEDLASPLEGTAVGETSWSSTAAEDVPEQPEDFPADRSDPIAPSEISPSEEPPLNLGVAAAAAAQTIPQSPINKLLSEEEVNLTSVASADIESLPESDAGRPSWADPSETSTVENDSEALFAAASPSFEELDGEEEAWPEQEADVADLSSESNDAEEILFQDQDGTFIDTDPFPQALDVEEEAAAEPETDLADISLDSDDAEATLFEDQEPTFIDTEIPHPEGEAEADPPAEPDAVLSDHSLQSDHAEAVFGDEQEPIAAAGSPLGLDHVDEGFAEVQETSVQDLSPEDQPPPMADAAFRADNDRAENTELTEPPDRSSEPGPGLRPEDFPLFENDLNSDGTDFVDESTATLQPGSERARPGGSAIDTLELDPSKADLSDIPEAELMESELFSNNKDDDFDASDFANDKEGNETFDAIDFTTDGEDDWQTDDQMDAADEFIHQVTDDDDEPASTSVTLTDDDLDNLDSDPSRSSVNWLVGIGLGVVCLGLLGILFNALLGNRQSIDPVAEQPVEMPVTGEGGTETPVAEEPEEPVAEEPEAPEPEPEATEPEEPDPVAEVPAEAQYFREAVNAAQNAANLAQTASTGEEWQAVADSWAQAIELMKKVPESDPNYATAQQKAVDYQPNLEYAQQNAERP